ncbi:MobP2 family relaxase [Enterococcus faecalis]|uniref:MobP2 family relaxase n=1 Tax=Enterococcus faecalis TaxID=1351 RepID=UPI000354486B|nr:MobP2 family relaxase [Enterococcus faecalis]EPH86360.1 hypothetical protein D924_00613 [Enterococcus faecalis 06-MB-S-10]EPH86687.1 hypothetical protein D927_00011 [Enterococcus faecalis 02-MB-BW-10]EPH91474.1 hypothetical protein D923_00877 [Enterococcus faecalis 06-MB-S-04]
MSEAKKRPGVVFAFKYVTGNAKVFKEYVDYLDREEAIRTAHYDQFNAATQDKDGYLEYMENPEKSEGIFTANKDELSRTERRAMKEVFQLAQEQDSVMWQGVISFDNAWLARYGFWDPKTKHLDAEALRKAVRYTLEETLVEEQLAESAKWAASIHYNTDNIHVHFAIVEPEPTRPYGTFLNRKTGESYQARKGSWKKKSLDHVRSRMVNSMLNRDQSLEKISTLIRKEITSPGYSWNVALREDHYRNLYTKIYDRLPNDKRLWKYNNNALKEVRPFIDQYIETYLSEFQPYLITQLDQQLKEEMEVRERAYGTGDIEYKRILDYRRNKYHELYTRLGNSLLRDMKEQDKERRKKSPLSFVRNQEEWRKTTAQKPLVSQKQLNKIKRGLDKQLEHAKNQRVYQQVIREQEQENSR